MALLVKVGTLYFNWHELFTYAFLASVLLPNILAKVKVTCSSGHQVSILKKQILLNNDFFLTFSDSKRPEINEEKIAEDTQDMNVSIQRQENNNTLPQSASSEYEGEKDKPGQKSSFVETAQSKEGALGGGSKEGTTAEESVAKDFDGQFSSASEEDGESADTPTVDKETSPSDVVDYIPTKDKQERQCEWFADDICKEWRRYSIDLAPKVSL